MKLNFTNLPTGNLPYEDLNLCKQMMIKLYEEVPFPAELPILDSNDNIIYRTISNLPAIIYKDKKLLLPHSDSKTLESAIAKLDNVYNDANFENLQEYSFESPFFSMYEKILKRIKPEYSVIKLLGPFSFCEDVKNQKTSELLTDKLYRKFLIQAFSIKSLWIISKINNMSPDTKVLILFDEPLLKNVGSLKQNEDLEKDSVVTLFNKIFQKIHSFGGFVGVQSFNKCDWLIPIKAGADMISFDAYNNPNNLNIIADKINSFLINGGYINWGIVPVMNENTIQRTDFDYLYNRFNNVIQSLAANGADLGLLLNHSTVSVQGDLSKISILQAEKALIIANQLSKKLPRFQNQ